MPIVMLLHGSDEDQAIEAHQAGANDYIGKPFRPRELVARREAHMRRTSVDDNEPVLIPRHSTRLSLGATPAPRADRVCALTDSPSDSPAGLRRTCREAPEGQPLVTGRLEPLEKYPPIVRSGRARLATPSALTANSYRRRGEEMSEGMQQPMHDQMSGSKQMDESTEAETSKPMGDNMDSMDDSRKKGTDDPMIRDQDDGTDMDKEMKEPMTQDMDAR
jgi:CheY-like chemotaxis protein